MALKTLTAHRERLLKFVSTVEPGKCWEWQSTVSARGYGKFHFRGRQALAHRASYEIHKGVIPAGLVIRHTCDNKVCVNPAHLITGTPRQNCQDAMERGQVRRGVLNGQAKLTPEKVRLIREQRAAGDLQRTLAERFGVSIAAIQWVLNGRSWKEVKNGQ